MKRQALFIIAMQFKLTALGLLFLCCVSASPAIAQVNGDRVQLIKNPAPSSGSIFVEVQFLSSAPPAEADFLLSEGTTESILFVVPVNDTIAGYTAEKTQILLTDSQGLSDALVVLGGAGPNPGGATLLFSFTSDSERPLNLNDFPGTATLIPETGNDQFPGGGAEALLNVTSLIFSNAPADATLPFTVLIGSDRDAVPEPASIIILLTGLVLLLLWRTLSPHRSSL